jgi:predicted permease
VVLKSVLQDLRYALRQARQAPGFVLTAVVTLALGIGATTAIFTLVQAVLLKSLPVTKPEELWRFGSKVHCCNWGGYTQPEEFSLFNNELYRKFRDNTPAFVDLTAFQGGDSQLGVRRTGSSQSAITRNAQFVSGNFFRTFGVGAWIGRIIEDSDDRAGAPPVAVMSFHTWQTKYGGDSSIVGSVFQLNGKPFTVVGIGAPGFFGAGMRTWGMADFWLPLAQEPLIDGAEQRLNVPQANWLYIFGRVRPGTDPKVLEAQLKLELRQWQMSHYGDLNGWDKEALPRQQFHLSPGGSGIADMREQYGDGLRLLLIASGCVLLIACANLANLLLVRGLKKRQQISVRMALGASRVQLVRKAFMESLALGLAGGLAGLLVAYFGTAAILHMAFSANPNNIAIDPFPSLPVLAFALGLSLLTGLIFGIAPAWMTSHAQPVEALRGANRTSGQKTKWPQKAFVVTQAAVSLVLLSAAAMLSQSLRNLEHQNFGFEPEGHYVAWLDPHFAGYQPDQLDQLYRRIDDRLLRIPGVQAVAGETYAPMSGDTWNESVLVQGKPAPHVGQDSGATWTRVTPSFFSTIGNSIVMGRPITEQDSANAPLVAVVNQAFVKKFFNGQNPIGKRFGSVDMSHAGDYEIVGVAADMRYLIYDLNKADASMFFLPELQHTKYSTPREIAFENSTHYFENYVLQVSGKPDALETQVRRSLADVDPNLTLSDFASYPELLQRDFGQQAMIAKLTLLFGALALVLAAVGLYGVTAYTVEQRTNEIGIRMALGANRSSVLSMVLRSAFLQVLIGLAIGIPAAIAAGRGISDQLYAVKPYDPMVLALATFLLGLAALLASVIPAQRAASINPTEALRAE